METKYIIGFLAATVVIVGAVVVLVGGPAKSVLASKYDMPAFAQCLKDEGALFYGAFWCPHCQATKALFGPDATKLLPYVECSTPDMQNQLPICIQKGIKSYPTWIFKDGSVLNGELSPDIVPTAGKISIVDLASYSGCSIKPLDGSAAILPQPHATSTVGTSTSSTTSSSAAR